jgi:hypothetical protein
LRGTVLALLLVLATTGNQAFPGPPPLPMPVPPIPPATPPLLDAPVPDVNAEAPWDDGRPPAVTLNMGLNRRRLPSPGFGYPPGSTYNDDDRRLLTLPGITLRVPFP